MRWRERAATGAPGRARWLVGVLLLGWTWVLGACRDPAAASGTALYVTVEFDSALLLTQLETSTTVQGKDPVGPTRLPEQPERFLRSGETFRVLLPSAPDEALAEVRLQGLRDAVPVAYGTGTARVRAGYEVDVTVRLLPASDGGLPPDAGFCPDCPDGCCIGGSCTQPGFNTCGSGGIACVRCDARTADECLPLGVCGCGGGPACTGPTVDRCEGGQCRCGSGGACAPGQECISGECRCTSTSCGGCCEGGTCAPGDMKGQCGRSGEACRKCSRQCNADGTCD